MLIRDAYFLQKERQWIDQERLKLNTHMSRDRKKQTERRTAQVQTSVERYVSKSAGKEHNQSLSVNHVAHHGPKESMGNNSSMTVDNLSLVSSLEQDRKKMQLLQTNLALEKEYNRDLNTQLTAQMELIKMQNEKLIEGETQINEMKLRLLLKFEQIKILEDYYNQQHAYAAEQQIHLDIEVDDNQLQQIVYQLYKKQKKTEDDLSYEDHMAKILKPKKNYTEFWAYSGIVSILRHLLMDRCKFNPTQHRLQYAFMLFRALTLGAKPDRPNLSGSQHLNALLQDNSMESQLNSSHKPEGLNLTSHSVIETKPVTERFSYAKEEKSVQVAIEIKNVDFSKDADWSELFWQKKRSEYFKFDQINTVD